jgi:hypothetical protein
MQFTAEDNVQKSIGTQNTKPVIYFIHTHLIPTVFIRTNSRILHG